MIIFPYQSLYYLHINHINNNKEINLLSINLYFFIILPTMNTLTSYNKIIGIAIMV